MNRGNKRVFSRVWISDKEWGVIIDTMNTNKHFCNHCGTELNRKSDYIDLVIEIGSNHIHGKYLDTNLCKNCVDELFLIVKDFCSSTIEDFTKLK